MSLLKLRQYWQNREVWLMEPDPISDHICESIFTGCCPWRSTVNSFDLSSHARGKISKEELDGVDVGDRQGEALMRPHFVR
jgi:hypothetical protein